MLKKHDAYQFWPVQTGYGVSTVDCLACVYGKFIAIETKAPGKSPTYRQQQTLEGVEVAGGLAMVIDSDEGVQRLDDLCSLIRK